jgi:hypothetical protein
LLIYIYIYFFVCVRLVGVKNMVADAKRPNITE